MSFDKAITLKVGDKFVEERVGKFIVTKDAEVGEGFEKRRTVKWEARKFDEKKPTSFLITEGLDHYGPRIYLEKEYT